MITKKQKQVFDFVKGYRTKHDYAPSLEEIKRKFKLASVSTAHYYLKKLQEAGQLKKEFNQPRAVSTIDKKQTIEIPIVGAIAADNQSRQSKCRTKQLPSPKMRLANKENIMLCACRATA